MDENMRIWVGVRIGEIESILPTLREGIDDEIIDSLTRELDKLMQLREGK